MSRKDVRFILARMADSSNHALAFIEGLTKQDFLGDLRTQQAVIMNLYLIGELAGTLRKNVSAELDRLPPLPYEQMIGMRNRIAHGYFDLNMDAVWEVVTRSLPELRCALAGVGISGTEALEPLSAVEPRKDKPPHGQG